MVASFVAQWGYADEVWLMPSGLNPLKTGHGPKVGDNDRLEMARLACEGIPGVEASGFELTLPRPTYTYVTLCRLREAYPACSFRLVIGSDNWKVFGQWRDTDKIISEFGVIIYPRPGYEVERGELPSGVELIEEAPLVLMSSTFVREAVGAGRSAAGFCPQAVAQYIADRGLYRKSP